MDFVVIFYFYTPRLGQFSHLIGEVSLCSKQQLMQKLTKCREHGSVEHSVRSGTLVSHRLLQSSGSFWKKEQQNYEGEGLGRTGGKQCLQDMTRPVYSQTHSSSACLHKTCTRASHSVFGHREGGCPESPPLNEELLMVDGFWEGRSPLWIRVWLLVC